MYIIRAEKALCLTFLYLINVSITYSTSYSDIKFNISQILIEQLRYIKMKFPLHNGIKRLYSKKFALYSGI